MTAMIKDTIRAIGLDGRIEVVEVPKVEKLQSDLLRLVDGLRFLEEKYENHHVGDCCRRLLKGIESDLSNLNHPAR